MPRVTSSEQFRRHRFVRMLFLEPGMHVLFALLSFRDQQTLHLYYATDDDLNEREFGERRRELDRRHPSLSHRAGRCFRVLERAFIEASRAHGVTKEQMRQAVELHHQRQGVQRPSPRRQGASRQSSRDVVVLPVARPTPDSRKLAVALTELARLQLAQKRARTAASSSSSGPHQTEPQADSATNPLRAGVGEPRQDRAA